MKSKLPTTGTEDFLDLISPFVPDDYLDHHWPTLKTGGRRCEFSSSQLWRLHLLALLTPVHSINMLVRLLPEQKGWRAFARLPRQDQVPDVRMLNACRARLGVDGLRRINEQLLAPVLERLDPTRAAVAIIDATDLPASCSGFKKKHPPIHGDAGSFGRPHAKKRPKPMFCRV